MQPEYDVFHPAGTGVAPARPYTITILKADGSFQTHEIKSAGELTALKPYVAYKIHKPKDPMEELKEDLYKQGFVSRYDAKRILTYLRTRGLLKLDAKPEADWLEQKMDELGLRYNNVRVAVRNWFEDPENYPEVNTNIGNRILTVKPSGGGRVVVLPTGHTIAYTKAREIYNEMTGDYTPYGYGSSLNNSRVRVGEYVGGSIRHTKHHLTINKNRVTVGCQVVPRQAIDDLAKREGW